MYSLLSLTSEHNLQHYFLDTSLPPSSKDIHSFLCTIAYTDYSDESCEKKLETSNIMNTTLDLGIINKRDFYISLSRALTIQPLKSDIYSEYVSVEIPALEIQGDAYDSSLLNSSVWFYTMADHDIAYVQNPLSDTPILFAHSSVFPDSDMGNPILEKILDDPSILVGKSISITNSFTQEKALYTIDHYVVAPPSDTNSVLNPPLDIDLVLFTCTDGAKNRYVYYGKKEVL